MLEINKQENDIKDSNDISNKKDDLSIPGNKETNQQNDSISFISHPIINNLIISQLIEFGYEKIYSQRLVQYFHPQDIEEALDYFSKVNGIIQHRFIQERDKNNIGCYVCGEKKVFHLGYIPNNDSNISNDDDTKNPTI